MSPRLALPDASWLQPIEFTTWRRRVDLERRAGNLTLHRRLALQTLISFNGEDGLYPSDKAVAQEAGLCARTVRRARQDARELGLLEWDRTRKLVDGRWRQGPNRYRLLHPTTLVCSSEGQRVRRGRKEVRKREHPAPEHARSEENYAGNYAERTREVIRRMAEQRDIAREQERQRRKRAGQLPPAQQMSLSFSEDLNKR